MPVLSYTESSALVIFVRIIRPNLSQHFRVDPPFDFLDPFVERLDRVVGQHRHRFLGEDRPLVDLEPGQVHGAAR